MEGIDITLFVTLCLLTDLTYASGEKDVFSYACTAGSPSTVTTSSGSTFRKALSGPSSPWPLDPDSPPAPAPCFLALALALLERISSSDFPSSGALLRGFTSAYGARGMRLCLLIRADGAARGLKGLGLPWNSECSDLERFRESGAPPPPLPPLPPTPAAFGLPILVGPAPGLAMSSHHLGS
ncbi:hypothetical protein EYF80_013273 [Liparis tanakae]|uniref:Uncharacterized protein n=1 Tax=Liparis tanakae TaxID=230148 RepID=A0A4Z2IEI7_9TELE|nr:hypothetical protein EYF80_013273 [Liparis tanakae]